MARIAVLGAGAWGNALVSVLENNNHVVQLWDHNPAITKYDSLSAAVAGVELILVVIPSHVFKSIIEQIKALNPQCKNILWATKGLDPTGKLLSNIASEILGDDYNLAMLSGPSFAVDVLNKAPTAVTVAASNLSLAEKFAAYFQNNYFKTYPETDLIGVQLGGIVKNILAVVAGISDGLELGANARAALITTGFKEMLNLGEALGAKTSSLTGLAGLGDMLLTCTDDKSRNRRYGLALGQGMTHDAALKKINQVVEAVYNIKQVHDLAKQRQVNMPVVAKLYSILEENAPAREALLELFQ